MNASQLFRTFLFGAVLSMLAFVMVSGPASTRTAEASPSVSAAVVDALGAEVPGFIPPSVILDVGDTVRTSNTNWKLLITFDGTEFGTRATRANGKVDAGFTTSAGQEFTLYVPSSLSGPDIEIEEILVKVVTPFCTFDAGGSTLQLDIGRQRDAGPGAPTVERYLANVNLLATGSTLSSHPRMGQTGLVNLDAGWLIPPRHVEAYPLGYRLTFNQSAKDLTACSGGRVQVYTKAGNIPTK